MFNFRKTMRFFLGAKYNLVLIIYGLGKLYTIIEFIFFKQDATYKG